MRTDAFSGGRWGAIRSVAVQLVSIGITAVLARILAEEEFGIVAITVVVLTMFELVTRVGLGATIVRREPLTSRVTSTFFWLSILLGLGAGGLAVAISGPAAALAGSREAAPLIALAAVTLPLNMASRVPVALLSRGFRFRSRATLEIVGTVAHGVVAITLAIAGLGAMAVVIGQIARSAAQLVGAFGATRFRPSLVLDRRIIGEELSFNVGWLTADLVTYANKNTDYWFVGNTLGTGPLGIYYVAYVIPNLLRQRVTSIGHEIIYPITSRIQNDERRILSALLRVIRLVTFLVVPAMLGLAVLADLAVRIGFGPDWTEAVSPLRMIAIAAAVTSMTVIANPVFAAMGRPWLQVSNGLLALLALGIGLVVALTAGTLYAVATAVLVAASVEAGAILARLRTLIGLTLRGYLAAVFPFVSSAIVMALVLWGIRHFAIGDFHSTVQALIGVLAGGVAYLGVGALFFREDFIEQWVAVRGLVIPSRAS